ncbi:hypothetical protein KSP40_PGU006852 [Platanthera guangdongensis]|uniref:Transcription factor CBF/NF-Y/archaeal histone domain-containing protein n=1 Tax=Platanthera guangdongensis TaxID=2320717 RepID=A0ABR2M1T5_9ASPA
MSTTEVSPAKHPSNDTADTQSESVAGALIPSFPFGRVKRIMKLDGEIKKVNSEALFLISLSTELFLESLAERAGNAAALMCRKTIKVEHLRAAVTDHSPTADFLLDCIPEVKLAPPPTSRKSGTEKPLPPGARGIQDFFSKQSEIAQ